MTPFKLLFAFISTALAVAPQCSRQGSSLQNPDGSFPYVMHYWANITSQTACQNLCLGDENCFASAYHSGYEQCHGYDNVVGNVGFYSTSSGYLFSDNCCAL